MGLKSLSKCLVASALAALSAPALAQDRSGLNIEEFATGERGGVAQFNLAQQLYAMGVKNQEALLVVTAARLASGVQMTEVGHEKETRPGGGDAADIEADDAAAPVDAAAMLAMARDLAGEDENMIGMIEDIEATGARGRIGGASRTLSRLAAGAVDVWKVPFFGESYAELGISGDGDTALGIDVTDESGNAVNCSPPRHDEFYCDFVPKWNGFFYVTVSNKGRVSNSYYFLTN